MLSLSRIFRILIFVILTIIPSVFASADICTKVSGNEITLSGDSSIGANLHGVSGELFEKNTITVEGKSALGIKFEGSSKITLKENKISTPNGYAIYIEPSEEKSDYDHTIDSTNTEQGAPIYYFFDQNDLDVTRNIADPKNIGQLYLAFCDNYDISDLSIYHDGITIANSNEGLIYKTTAEYEGCGVSGVSLVNTRQASVVSSTLEAKCPDTAEVSLENSKEAIFSDTKYTNVYFYDAESVLHRLWYLTIKVVDTEGKPIKKAKVTGFNQNGREHFGGETDSDGIAGRTLGPEFDSKYVTYQRPTEYLQYGYSGMNPVKYSHSPYTIVAEKDGKKNSIGVELDKTKEVTIVLGSDSDKDIMQEKCDKKPSACASDQTCILPRGNLAGKLKNKKIEDLIHDIDLNENEVKKLYPDIDKLKRTVRLGCVPNNLPLPKKQLKIDVLPLAVEGSESKTLSYDEHGTTNSITFSSTPYIIDEASVRDAIGELPCEVDIKVNILDSQVISSSILNAADSKAALLSAIGARVYEEDPDCASVIATVDSVADDEIHKIDPDKEVAVVGAMSYKDMELTSQDGTPLGTVSIELFSGEALRSRSYTLDYLMRHEVMGHGLVKLCDEGYGNFHISTDLCPSGFARCANANVLFSGYEGPESSKACPICNKDRKDYDCCPNKPEPGVSSIMCSMDECDRKCTGGDSFSPSSLEVIKTYLEDNGYCQ